MNQRQRNTRADGQHGREQRDEMEEQATNTFVNQAEGPAEIVDIVHVLQQLFHDPGYLTIDSSGPALSLSPLCVSASSVEALLDSFAYAIARWKSSQR